MMLAMGLRLLAILLVIIAVLLDVKQVRPVVQRPLIQLLMVVVLIAVILADPVAGLVCAVAAMALYIRIFDVAPKESIRVDGNFNIVKTPYVTAEYLRSAQSNVINQKEVDTGIKGFRGVYGEPVYGAQGLDKDMPGYTPFM